MTLMEEFRKQRASLRNVALKSVRDVRQTRGKAVEGMVFDFSADMPNLPFIDYLLTIR